MLISAYDPSSPQRGLLGSQALAPHSISYMIGRSVLCIACESPVNLLHSTLAFIFLHLLEQFKISHNSKKTTYFDPSSPH